MPRRWLCLLACLFLLAACQSHGGEPDVYLPPAVEADAPTPANCYLWSHPSVFDGMEPLILESVSPERFAHDHASLAGDEPATGAFLHTVEQGDDVVTLGTFRVDEAGKLIKLCPEPACRADHTLPCAHLRLPGDPGIWHNGSFYCIATTLEPESGSTLRWYILRLGDQADAFEKLFETERPIQTLHVTGGILYAHAPAQFEGDSHTYFVIDPEMRVWTEIVRGSACYQFGADRILMTDDTGSYLTDAALERAGQCCAATALDRQVLLAGDAVWYLTRDGILWRAEAKVRGKTQRMMEQLLQFTVCGDRLFYQPIPAEPAEVLFSYDIHRTALEQVVATETHTYTGFRHASIRVADITPDGKLRDDRLLFAASEDGWLHLFNTLPRLGNAFTYTTVRPDPRQTVTLCQTCFLTDGSLTQAAAVTHIPRFQTQR